MTIDSWNCICYLLVVEVLVAWLEFILMQSDTLRTEETKEHKLAYIIII